MVQESHPSAVLAMHWYSFVYALGIYALQSVPGCK